MVEQNIVTPALRAWQSAGLKYLYFTSPEALSLHKKSNLREEKASQKLNVRSNANNTSSASELRTNSPSSKLAPQVVAQNKAPVANPANQISTQSQAKSITQATNFNSNLKLENPILDFSAWSEAWLDIYAKTSPSPLVLWTYQEFGDDLLGSPNPARRKLIAYFLSNLGHSKGTHSFWPTDIPNNPVDPQEASLFWSGVEKLKPRALVVFGEETRDKINLPSELKAYANQRINSKFTLLLPNINKLVESPEMVNSVLAFLQSSLDFARRD